MATTHPIPTVHNFKNLTGQEFGNLTVVSYAGRNKWRNATWNCVCRCGNEAVVATGHLADGIKSCGCLAKQNNFRHGFARSRKTRPEYYVWYSMKQRCSNPKVRGFKYYGALGVRVCKRWQTSFIHFIADMGLRPSAKHSIDRYPNNAGNYEPGNCRWATRKQQRANRRKKHSHLK